MHPDDMAGLPAAVADLFVLAMDEATLRLPLRAEPSLPRGVVGLPLGLPELPYVALPTWGRLAGVKEE
jgi:hypothetical protein